MTRKAAFAVVIVLFVGFDGFSQSESPSLLSLSLVPSFNVPMGSDTTWFALGGGGKLVGEYRMPFLPLLFAGAEGGFSYVPLTAKTTMSLVSGGAVAGVRFDFLKDFTFRITASGGYFYAFLNDGSGHSGSNPFVSIGGDLSWTFVPALSAGLGASYRDFLGLYNDIAVTLGMSYNFPGGSQASPPVKEQAPVKPAPLTNAQPTAPNQALPNEKNKGVAIYNLTFNKVFPIFHAWYDSNPIGKVTIRNTDSSPATDITVSLFIKRYMDDAKECATIPVLQPGESKDVDLLALFGDNILEITQTTKVSAAVNVAYTRNGAPATASKVETVNVYDRNAMTWDDNQKAAAFVTPKEPTVLYFSNNVNAMVKSSTNRVLDKNLQTGMIFHDALHLYGISYVSPPLTSYAVVSQDKTAVDSLKFPRETFSYRSGDCSDLSILYCSLLESVQIETAFITVPGHIFMAFALDMQEDQARKAFTKTDELIFQGGKAWVPIEVTERDTTFITAWQEGAKEWRENLAKKQADFYPVRTAWKTYPAVFFPGASTQPALPDASKVVIDFQADLIALISREIGSRETELKALIKKNPNDAKAINSLGLLYARYDLADKAQAQFQILLTKGENVPALLNLGNLAFLKADYRKAQGFYQRAYQQSPHSGNVLLAMARVNHAQQNYGSVKEYYQELQTVDPDVASQFAYLDLQGAEATRAAEANNVLNTVVWEEAK
jgi:hypothetical protein